MAKTVAKSRQLHYLKSVEIRSYFWSEYRKIRTRNNSVFGHFSRSAISARKLQFQYKYLIKSKIRLCRNIRFYILHNRWSFTLRISSVTVTKSAGNVHVYVRIHVKTIPWKFRILNPKNSRVMYPTIANFSKSRLIFNIFYCFWMLANKLFTHLTCAHLFNVKSSTYYFYMTTKTLADFQICISVTSYM